MNYELDSEAILVHIDTELAELLVKPGDLDSLRPAPGIRGAAADLATGIFIATSAGANLTTLILAKDNLLDFSQRLLDGIRARDLDEVELSSKIGSTELKFAIKTSDPDLDIAGALQQIVDAIAAAEASSES